jgi:tetratricopeptide (TPR) repeat protein
MKEYLRVRLEGMFQEADRLINAKSTSEGFNLLTTIITEEPSFGKAYNHLGYIYYWRYKDNANAEKHYKMSLELSPEYLAGYYNYATFLSSLKRWDELTTLLNKALKVPGINEGTIYNEFGIMYESQRKYREATEAYKNYLAFTLDNEHVDKAIESINRCKKKMELLG